MGRGSAFEKWKATISFVTSVLPHGLRWLSLDRLSFNFIFWTSIKTLIFWINVRIILGRMFKAPIISISTSSRYSFFQLRLFSFWDMSWSRRNRWRQKRQQSSNLVWSLPVFNLMVFTICRLWSLLCTIWWCFEVSNMIKCKSVCQITEKIKYRLYEKLKISMIWNLLKNLEIRKNDTVNLRMT